MPLSGPRTTRSRMGVPNGPWGVVVSAGTDGVVPLRSVHAGAQVLAVRLKALAQRPLVTPFTTTYIVLPRTAQTGWSMITPVGFLSQDVCQVPAEKDL